MNERVTGQPLRVHVLTERATLRAAESEMSNYRSAQEAVLELVDNAVDDMLPGTPVTIIMRSQRDEIYIYNEGGNGLDLDGLENFLSWGHSDKRTDKIGKFGVGGKAAAGFLGNSIKIRCSARGSDREYRLTDDGWSQKREVVEQPHQVEEFPAHKTDQGYFEITISELRGRPLPADQLANLMGDVYKPLLEQGKLIIKIKGQPIKPLEIKHLTTDPQLEPIQEIVTTNGFGHQIRIANVGVLEPGQKVKPGLRLYYRGRKIEDGQYFELPTPAQLPQASRLSGEVHLDNLAVTTSKTGFIRDLEYTDSVQVVSRLLKPWVEKLKYLKLESTQQVEVYEQQLAKAAQRVFDAIASSSNLLATDVMFNRANTQYPLEGSLTTGGMPPRGSLRFDDEALTNLPPNGGQGRDRGPVTPGGQDTGIRTKVNFLADWQVVSMGNPELRVVIVPNGKKHTVKINPEFPMYQEAKSVGGKTLEQYILQTAFWQLGRVMYKEQMDNFPDWYDRVLQSIGDYYQKNKTS